MHKIIMWLGGIIAALGGLLVVMALLVIFGLKTQGAGIGVLLPTGLSLGGGLIVSGAILYCFGAIVEHLIAIRKNGERQLEIFDRLGRPK